MKKRTKSLAGGRIRPWVIHGVLIVFCFVCLLPLLMTISISLTDGDSIARYGYRLIPDRISLKAYEYVFGQPQQVITGYRNSLYITIVGTVLNVFVTAMAAYPLSRADFRFRSAVSVYIFVTMIFSGGLVASYILVVRYLHLKNSLMALILLPVAAPYNIFLTRILFQDISPSLIEAAELDGSGEFNTFIRIVMPLSMPIIATITLMIVLGYWNESFNAMLYIDDAGKRPMQLILYYITSYINEVKSGMNNFGSASLEDVADVPSDSIMYAMMIVSSAPVMFVFLFLQKYFVKGLTVGSVKG